MSTKPNNDVDAWIKRTKGFLSVYASGAAAGALAKTATYPFVLWKTLQQTTTMTSKQALQKPLKGALVSIGKTGLSEGIRQKLYLQMVKEYGWSGSMAGFLSGNGALLLVYPMDTLYNQWIHHKHPYDIRQPGRNAVELYRAAQTLWQNRAVYKGLTMKFIAAAPFNLLYGGLFKRTHDFLQTSLQHTTIETQYKVSFALAGGLSAGITASLTHPLDTMVRRIQKLVPGSPHSDAWNAHAQKNSTLAQIGRHIPLLRDLDQAYVQCRNDPKGRSLIRVLYGGLLPNILKTTPSYAIRAAGFAKLINLDTLKDSSSHKKKKPL